MVNSPVMNSTTSSAKWLFLGLASLLAAIHFLAWHSANRLFDLVIREKANLFLEALSSSADQTLQASHFLEERIVSRLKTVSGEILQTPWNQVSPEFLQGLTRQHDLRGISIYDLSGKVVVSNDSTSIGGQLPESFECHEVLHGKRAEHVFGFSKGIFCEADAFGYAVKLPNGCLLRILTGVEFVLGFEKSVGLPALINRFRKHPGVRFLDFVDLKGASLLGEKEKPIMSPEGITASQSLFLHDQPVGRFEVSLEDSDLNSLRQTSTAILAFSTLFSFFVLWQVFWRIERDRQLREHQQQIEDSNKRIEGLGKIVAAVAHEVRNPLNTLALGISALQDDMKNSSPVQGPETLKGAVSDRFEMLNKAVQEANQMMKELLQTAHPILPSIRPFPLDGFSQALKFALETGFPKVTLNIRFPEGAMLESDQELLKRILVNLLTNAAQAGASQITLEFLSGSGETVLRVVDNGPGIPKEILPNLFVPGNTGRPDGFGLGLYNCHRMTYSLGGKLEVTSSPAGTSFTIRLPKC